MSEQMKKEACKKEMEVYARVVGFYRPTRCFNKGKLEEFKERKEYNLSKIEEKTSKIKEAI